MYYASNNIYPENMPTSGNMEFKHDGINKPLFSYCNYLCVSMVQNENPGSMHAFTKDSALYKQNHPPMILNLRRGKDVEDMEYYFIPRNAVL